MWSSESLFPNHCGKAPDRSRNPPPAPLPPFSAPKRRKLWPCHFCHVQIPAEHPPRRAAWRMPMTKAKQKSSVRRLGGPAAAFPELMSCVLIHRFQRQVWSREHCLLFHSPFQSRENIVYKKLQKALSQISSPYCMCLCQVKLGYFT